MGIKIPIYTKKYDGIIWYKMVCDNEHDNDSDNDTENENDFDRGLLRGILLIFCRI